MNKQKVIAGEKLQKLDLVVKREDEKYYKVRSKQEEIRDEVYRILLNKKHDVIQDLANSILSYLHSQKCRIQVDRELPHSRYADLMFNSKGKSQIKENMERNNIYEEAQLDMLKWYKDSLEPLIVEEK